MQDRRKEAVLLGWVLSLNLNGQRANSLFKMCILTPTYLDTSAVWLFICLSIVWLSWVGKKMFAEAWKTHPFPLLSLTI